MDSETRLTEMLREAIVAYEPRLADPRVRIAPAPRNGAFVVHVDGGLRLGTVIEPVSFAVSIERGGERYGD
jgi:predicted component of type VI protein secretion system